MEITTANITALFTGFDVIFQRGQHAMLYGERGVGKTSLAKVVSEALEE